MKKTVRYLILMVMTVALAAGCSKDSGGDAESLIKTIPADASTVAVVNIEHSLDRLGCSTDGTTVKLSKDLQKAIDESPSMKADDKKLIKDICDGETGISLTSIVYFSAARSYVTGLLNDPDRFVAYISRSNPADSVPAKSVREEDGARIVGPVAVLGNQFWVCMTGTPDVEQLKYYQQLNGRQSYTSSEAAPVLQVDGKVVTYVADVNRLLGGIPEAASMRMSASLMFKDMAYVAGSADLDRKKFTACTRVLNSDMKPAELLLPAKKIDAGLLKSFNGNGGFFFAAGFSKELAEKLSGLAGTAMGPMSKQIAAPLSQIDGTIALRADDAMNAVEAKVQTSGKDFAELSNVIQNLFGMTVTRDGNVLTASLGGKEITGAITSASAADRLKGAWIGVMASDIPAKGNVAVARLSEEKKSLRLDVEVEGGLDAFLTALLK